MNAHAVEVWAHAPRILEKLQGVAGRRKETAKEELLALLGISGAAEVIVADDSKPGVEDFEYALHTAALDGLESDSDEKVDEVADMLDVTASVVVELFERAAQPGMPSAETDRCKNWWSMLLSVAEDVSRLIPLKHMERFVRDLEESLVKLRAAYLKLAMQRLQEFDARQEVEQKAAEENPDGGRDAADPKGSKDQKARESKDLKDKETRRTEERKKMITQLGISPNGQLYLTLTSLLKQLCSRLCSSLHTPLRARIVLLLERLLAMDHKAIANNQKLKTLDFVQPGDLDGDSADAFGARGNASVLISNGDPSTPAQEDAKTEADVAVIADVTMDDAAGATVEAPAATATGAAPASLSSDPAVDFQFYCSFWGLQEALHYPEKLFESPDSWAHFQKALFSLLKLFLKYPSQDNARQPWSPPEPAPLRHAPRARALGVQLDDPGFRQQFLTQVMIAFQALEQDGSSRRGDSGGLISRQSELVRSEFGALKKNCETALAQTRKGFEPVLKHVLDRESHWVSWKGNGCREFEHESLEMLNAKISPADKLPEKPLPSRVSKPHLAPYVNGLLKTLKDPQWRVPSAVASSDEEAAKAMRPHAMREMCDKYLDRLLDEEKPESQVEEEYMAKRNKVFMWQCRRLFCQQYLRFYSQKDVTAKTDFMDFVRIVKGKPLATPAVGSTVMEDGPPAAETADGGVEESPQDAPAEQESSLGVATVASVTASASADSCVGMSVAPTATPEVSATPATLATAVGAQAAAGSVQIVPSSTVPAATLTVAVTEDASSVINAGESSAVVATVVATDVAAGDAGRGTKREAPVSTTPTTATTATTATVAGTDAEQKDHQQQAKKVKK